MSSEIARDAARPAAGTLLLLAGVAVCWGLNWPIMKVALGDIPVLSFRALGLMTAGPVFLAVAALRGDRLAIPRREVAPLLLATLCNVTLWYLLSATGLALMAAGRAGIIAYSMPAWVVLFGAMFLGERLTGRRLLGLALGMAGLAVLLLPDLGRLAAAPLGVLAMLLAAIDWAAGTIVMKRFRWTLGVTALSGWQLTLGGLPILLAAVVVGPFPGLERAGTPALLASAYTIGAGMIFAQWGWYKVLGQLPATVAALGTLAIPMIALLSSALLLREPLGADELAALTLMIAALALIMLRPAGERR